MVSKCGRTYPIGELIHDGHGHSPFFASGVIPQPLLFLMSVVARAVVDDRRECRDIEGLRGRMGESTRQVEGLFEYLLSESFSS